MPTRMRKTRRAPDEARGEACAPSGAKVPLFYSRDYALLWFGQAVSSIGDWVFDTVLVLWIADRIARGASWAPLAVSGVFLATALSTSVVGPLAGVFVDRWDARRTMLRADALRALLITALLLVSLAPSLAALLPGGASSLAHRAVPQGTLLVAIYLTVGLAAACARFFAPARAVLGADLVPEAYRAQTSGLGQVTTSLALIVGPAIGTWLFFGFGLAWALALNAFSFAVSLATLLLIHTPARQEAPVTPAGAPAEAPRYLLREFAVGLRFFGSNRVLRALSVALVLVLLGGGAANTLEYFFVTENLHASPVVYGYVSVANGAGLLLGAILASGLARRVAVARLFWIGVVGVGVLEVIYARLGSVGPALVVLALQGMLNAALNIAVAPLVLHVTPRSLVGRAFALLVPLMNLAGMLSALVAGYLDSSLLRGFHLVVWGVVFGPLDTIFSVAGLLAIFGGLQAMLALRGLRLEGEDAVASA